MDFIAKDLRKNSKPFGGIQVIFVGDFLQLPPIKTNKFCFYPAVVSTNNQKNR